MIKRFAWAGLAAFAVLAALGFAAAAATLALAQLFGVLIAASVMTLVLAGLAGTGAWLALRDPQGKDVDQKELLAVRIAREVIRKQPMSAVALCGALGFAVARRPAAAADIGKGVAKLMLP
jgi:hypothetical protein